MKLLNYKLASTIVIIGMLSVTISCSDNSVSSQIDSSGTPEITGVRYVNPDSSRNISNIGPGAVVALQGNNMDATTNVYFNGIEASFNPALMTDTTVIVTVPGDLPFGSMDPESETFNTIKVSNQKGESILDFNVVPPAPVISSISDEFAEAGKEITLGGQYLYLVTEVIFPGDISVEEFQDSEDGSSLSVSVPEGAQSGDITVISSGGTSTSSPGVGFWDTSGMICNFDDVFTYQYWSAPLSSDASLYPGNEGQYAIFSASGVNSGDNAWWTGGRSINLNPTQWVDPSNLDDNPSNFAVKFEINVKGTWENGTLLIRAANPWTYTARLEPWKDNSDYASLMETSGWETVQIPLNEFRTASGEGVNGAGSSIQSLSTMLPNGEAATAGVMLMNDTEGMIGNLNLAIDNIRVVRIAY